MPEYAPVLTGDPAANSTVLAGLLADRPPGTVRLPPGTHPLATGLVLEAGWTLTGDPAGTWLAAQATDGTPVVHVVGSDVEVSGLGLQPPPAAPGEHAGDRGTAITVGNYLYAEAPRWVEHVRLSDLHVRRRPGDRAANCVAVMGAVRDVELSGLTIEGGYTGLAVHWGAVGASVATLTAPTYHPHRLRVRDLRVADAVEGFYLSSVYDVRVERFCLARVDIGFRLLAGDNTDRLYAGDAVVGSGVEISGGCISWQGHLYGLRVAGWGRSEVDGVVSTLEFRDVHVRDVTLTALDGPAAGASPRSPVVLEAAHGVALDGIAVRVARQPGGGPCCALRESEPFAR